MNESTDVIFDNFIWGRNGQQKQIMEQEEGQEDEELQARNNDQEDEEDN
mgnify:FL=1